MNQSNRRLAPSPKMEKATPVAPVQATVTTQGSTEMLASVDQVAFLIKRGKWNYQDASVLTSLVASRHIKKIIDDQRKKKAEPPTQFQIDFLVKRGAEEAVLLKLNKGICSTMIYKIKKSEEEAAATA